MNVLFILLPLALLLAAGFVVVFVWAVRSGQFDDMDTPGMRMLHDDEPLRRDAANEVPRSDRAVVAQEPGDDDSADC